MTVYAGWKVIGLTTYRLYNPNSGEHFYTSNEVEHAYLKKIGCKDEGIGWTAPARSNTPVYRLYDKNSGDHHYTVNEEEKTCSSVLAGSMRALAGMA